MQESKQEIKKIVSLVKMAENLQSVSSHFKQISIIMIMFLFFFVCKIIISNACFSLLKYLYSLFML